MYVCLLRLGMIQGYCDVLLDGMVILVGAGVGLGTKVSSFCCNDVSSFCCIGQDCAAVLKGKGWFGVSRSLSCRWILKQYVTLKTTLTNFQNVWIKYAMYNTL